MPAIISDRLSIGPTGLQRYNPANGHYYAVRGLKTYCDPGFIHELTDPLPMKNITQSQIDGYDVRSGERATPRPAAEPSLLYVTCVRLFRAAVALGLLAGAGACLWSFFSTVFTA